jgi:hypothetical protein
VGGVVHRPAEIEPHLPHGQLVGDRPGIGQRPSQTVELGDDQGVAFAAGSQRFTQPWPLPVGAGQPAVNLDTVYTQRGEAVTLGCQVLLIGRTRA